MIWNYHSARVLFSHRKKKKARCWKTLLNWTPRAPELTRKNKCCKSVQKKEEESHFRRIIDKGGEWRMMRMDFWWKSRITAIIWLVPTPQSGENLNLNSIIVDCVLGVSVSMIRTNWNDIVWISNLHSMLHECGWISSRRRVESERRRCRLANKFTDFCTLSVFGAASISSLGLAGWLTVPYYSYTHLAFYSNVFLRVVVTKRKIEDTTQIKLDLSEHNMSEERIHSAQTNICDPKRRFLLVFRRPNSLYADASRLWVVDTSAERNYKLFANTELTNSGGGSGKDWI